MTNLGSMALQNCKDDGVLFDSINSKTVIQKHFLCIVALVSKINYPESATSGFFSKNFFFQNVNRLIPQEIDLF